MAAVFRTRKCISLAQKVILKKRIPTMEFNECEEDLKRFKCIQCHQVAIFHFQLQCSHILCDDCFATLHSSRCPAPACRMLVSLSEEQDSLFEEALSELRVVCPNKGNGCHEVIPLWDLLAHEQCCHHSQPFSKEAKDLATCKQQIRDLQQQVLQLNTRVMQLQKASGQPCPRLDNGIKELVVEEIRKERAKEHLKLETKLLEKFQHSLDEKMHLIERRIENRLKSKQQQDFQTIENLIFTRVAGNCGVIIERTSKKLLEDIDRLQMGLQRDLLNKTKNMQQLLEEKSKAFIEEVLDVKCPEIEMRSLKEIGVFHRKIETILKSNLETDFQNLERHMWSQLNDNCDVIQETMIKRATEKFGEDVHKFQEDLESHLSQNANDIKIVLEEKSKGFIEEVLDVRFPKIEKRSFDKLVDSLQKYSDELLGHIKSELDNEFKESTEWLRNVKEEMELKGKEEQERIFRDLEKGLRERYESEKEHLKNYIIGALNYSKLQSDVTSLSLAVNHQLPMSKTLIWNLGNFKNKIKDQEITIQSGIFDIPEFGCQIRFSFILKSWRGWGTVIQVEYLEQATDKVNPLSGHHRITFTLKDQLQDNKYKDFIRIFEPSFNNWATCTLGFPSYLIEHELKLLYSRWLKDGNIEMTVTLEPIVHMMSTEPRQYGSLIWKIDRYSYVRESFRHGQQCALSPSFYSSEKGYRLKGYFYIGPLVYFRLYFLKGPWDNDLPKKFKHRTTVCIISQQDKAQLKDRIFTRESSDVDCDEFKSLIPEDLKKYVKNDSLVISFKIEPLEESGKI